MRNPLAKKAPTVEQLEQAIQDAKKEQAAKTETDTTTEIPIGFRLPVEFTKIKKGKDEQGHRVVTRRIKVRWGGTGKTTFIQRGSNLHYLDTESLMWEPQKGKKKGYHKLQFDENLCEPLGADGKAHRNPIVSMILRDESMMQLVQIAQQFLPLTITKQMLIVVGLFAGMALVIGLGFNEVFHTAPTETIHWLNSKPAGIP